MPVKLPGIHEKVVPATVLVTLSIDVSPLQIVAGVAVGVNTKFGFTVTNRVVEPMHPAAVPVTVYVVVVDGDTETGVPIKLPGIQEKVVPATELVTPSEVDSPIQIVAGVAKGVNTGFGLTVTNKVAEPVQPAAVPVTVYVVEEFGVTITGVPFKLPGIHKKVVPAIVLVTLSEVDDPSQIAAGVAVDVIIGFGLTVTITVAEPVHPAAVPVTV